MAAVFVTSDVSAINIHVVIKRLNIVTAFRKMNHGSHRSAYSRIRKRPVSFGNPALGVYHGIVYTTSRCNSESSSTDHSPLVEGALDTSQNHLVAMVDVPPGQVPEGILNLARPHQPWIVHVRIVIAEADTGETKEGDDSSCFSPGKPLLSAGCSHLPGPPSMDASETFSSTLIAEKQLLEAEDLHSDTFTGGEDTPSRTYLVLIELTTQEAADLIVEDLHTKPYTYLDETQVCSIYHVIALQGNDGVSLMSPMFAPGTKSSRSGGLEILSLEAVTDLGTPGSNHRGANGGNRNAPPNHSEDYHCAVCLEHLNLIDSHDEAAVTPILTTVCNHSFHLECLLKWQDSPCPVCRYDHSGLDETLSQCHKCGTTENNFVCLICGVISCGMGRTSTVAVASTTDCGRASQSTATATSNYYNRTTSMVPTTSPSASVIGSHARNHYDETLHAYALDTESQHVWDFAGQGYVHRLLQNKDDGKLVEVSDPNNTTSQERNETPELSDAQEGEMVHRKLEGYASQYYTLLKSQLEQQRIFYEGRLEEIRHEFDDDQRNQQSRTNDLIAALRVERNQLSQRLQSLQSRCRKAQDDVSFLRNMNESLEANKTPMQEQLRQAHESRTETRKLYQNLLPPLQEKVTRLMLQLENEPQREQARHL